MRQYPSNLMTDLMDAAYQAGQNSAQGGKVAFGRIKSLGPGELTVERSGKERPKILSLRLTPKTIQRGQVVLGGQVAVHYHELSGRKVAFHVEGWLENKRNGRLGGAAIALAGRLKNLFARAQQVLPRRKK